MPPTSIASQATKRARRTVALALLVAGGLLAGATLERFVFQSVYDSRVQHLISVHERSAQIYLLDERLTMSAKMAAESGLTHWVERYETAVPVMDTAIAEALELAPSEAARQFEEVTKAANEELVMLELAALDAVHEGDLPKARQFLNSPQYYRAKGELDASADAFIEESTERAVESLNSAQDASRVGGLVAFLIFCVCAWVLWRRLARWLGHAETAQIQAEERIRQLAMHDVLTGLPNRRAMHDALKGMIARATRRKSSVALMVIDLDRFKPINDHHGHLIGDLVLKEVARRLGEVLRDDELRARFGGDEFVAAIEVDVADREAVSGQVARRIIHAVTKPMTFDSVTVQVGASIGIASFPNDTHSVDDLFRMADLALYAVKESGRGAATHYAPTMDQTADETAQLELDLPRAVERGEVVPYFQPLIDLETQVVRGFEILARWTHPELGEIPPDRFIPIAERIGMIGPLTTTLLGSAARSARSLPEHMTLAINIAAQQITSDSLVDELVNAVEKEGFPPNRLEVELTENALVTDLPSARLVISAFKARGVRIALDDFGTGYSSLCYLSELPIDKIKIDQSFMRSLHDREESRKVVNAIIGLGRSLGVPTLAEGIEDARDVDVLQELGCDSGQGYFYSRPVPASALQQFLGDWPGLATDAANTDIAQADQPKRKGEAAKG